MSIATASEVSALAAGQWGLVTTTQASAVGVSRMQLSRMVDAGLLDRVMHGVYATPGVQGDQRLNLRAAWLTLDPATPAEERMVNLPTAGVVSHASAAQLLGLGDLVADEHEFTVPRRRQSTRLGVRTRKGVLGPDEVTIAEGLPVTTAARTVADLLMAGHDLEHVAAVVADALRRDATDAPALEVALAPAARRHGARDGAELLVRLLDLSGMGVADLQRQVLDNDLGRELVRQAADAQSIAALVALPGMVDALESLTRAARAVAVSPAIEDAIAQVYSTSEPLISPGVRAAAEAMARKADTPEMRAALSRFAQAQRLYDSLGTGALEAVERTRPHASPTAEWDKE